jgi:GNAT superfamily N-acetyltransferase
MKSINHHHHPVTKIIFGRSIGARLHSLQASKDSLPTCLVLIDTLKASDESRNSENNVLAHLKLTPIPSIPFACFIESVVVWKELRGQGIGRYLMSEAEKHCQYNLKFTQIYLSTTDKEDFYGKLGYKPCAPVSIFGGPSNFPFRPSNTKKKYMKKILVEDDNETTDD